MKKLLLAIILIAGLVTNSFAADSTSFNPLNISVSAESSSSGLDRHWYSLSIANGGTYTNNYGYEIIVAGMNRTDDPGFYIYIDGVKIFEDNVIYEYGDHRTNSAYAMVPNGSTYRLVCSGNAGKSFSAKIYR